MFSSIIFDDIRRACKEVAEHARFVTIATDRLADYATSLPLDKARSATLDPAYHYLGHGEATLTYILALDAINFGSGYFPYLRKRPGLSGYFTVALSLQEHFANTGAFSAEALSAITDKECARIFNQDWDGGPQQQLMQLFARAWNDLGHYLLTRFAGSPSRLVASAEASAARLVAILAEMPYFQDVANYHGLAVPFYKRAQLTAADLALAFANSSYGTFADLEHLTIFADNLVPHVLHVDAVLRYDDKLAAAIEQGTLIPSGSQEEIEIRACALHAVELLVETLRRNGQSVHAHGLDYLLWNRGQQPAYKARPRHRTRTVFY